MSPVALRTSSTMSTSLSTSTTSALHQTALGHLQSMHQSRSLSVSLSEHLVCWAHEVKSRGGSTHPLSLSSLTASSRLTTLIVLTPRCLAYEISSCPSTLVAAFCSTLHGCMADKA